MTGTFTASGRLRARSDGWTRASPASRTSTKRHEVNSRFSETWDVPVVLVLDEVHRAANAKAKRTKGVRGLTPHAKRVVGLTGTPVEDDPFLLASLLTTCCCNPFDRDLLAVLLHEHKKVP
jgi:hypothetical protein